MSPPGRAKGETRSAQHEGTPVSGVQTDLLRASRWKPWEPLVWLLAFAAPLLIPSHALIINEVAIVGLFAVSLDLVLGYTGIVSLGHAAFFGLGAYTAALFCKHVSPDPHLGCWRRWALPRCWGSPPASPSCVAPTSRG